MELKIEFDSTSYHSDTIEHGRTIKKFVKKLCHELFRKTYLSYEKQNNFGIDPELYLLYKERNLYSLLAASIDAITPIHLSEWGFNKSDTGEKTKRVDFWCLHKNGNAGKELNYFIELKKNAYCVSQGTAKKLTGSSASEVKKVLAQIKDLKNINPEWGGSGNVYLGMIVTHGYRATNRNPDYNHRDLRDEIHRLLDKRSQAQFLFSTWIFPKDNVQWGNHTYDFIAISTIVITKQINSALI